MTVSPAPGAGSAQAESRPAAAPSPEIGWRRLSPGMLLVEPVREIIRFIPMLLVLVIAGSGNESGPPWGLIGTGLVVVLGLARYLSTRYRITPAVVEVRRGIVQRKHLTVPRDRIRTMDVSAHPLQRLLRLVRVDIGTGSSHASAPRARLDGLPASTVPALRTELLHRANGPPAPDELDPDARDGTADTIEDTDPRRQAEIELSRLRPGWIAFAPATLSGVVTGAVLIGFGFRLMREARFNPAEFGPVRQALGYLRGHSVWLDVGLAVVAVVLAVMLLSVAGYVLSFWGFRLSRHPGGTLQISRGLLTTRSTSIAERRLRGVQRREPLVLRWARGARLHAVATGLRRSGGQDGAEGGSSLLMPPAPAVEVRRVEAAVLGDERLVRAPLTAHGPAARRRRYIRALAGAAVVAAGLVGFTWWADLPTALYPVGVVLALAGAWLLAADRYRSLGHSVVDGHVVVRLGSLHRRRTVLAIDGIIGVTIRQSLFQRRAGLVTVIATTAAGSQHYDIPDLPETVAIDLARTLVPASRPLIGPAGRSGRRSPYPRS
jgi:putative membrane protein